MSTTRADFDDGDFYELNSRQEEIEFLLRYAILAPSTHNAQPWTFRMTAEGVHVYPDLSRSQAVADPDHRELLMSLGAAIANLRVAAAHFGFETTLLFPAEAEEKIGAFVGLRETCAPDEKLAALFGAIRARRTNRRPFENEPIEPGTLEPVLDFIDEHPDSFDVVLAQEKTRLADLIAISDKMQMEDDSYRTELAKWIRADANTATDGLPASVVGFPAAAAGAAPMIVRHLDLGGWQAYRDRDLVGSAAFLVILASDDDTVSLIQAGQDLELFLLTVTKAGLQYSFLNAPIQMPQMRGRLQTLTRLWRPPQLLIRVGPGRPLHTATPRRPLEDVLT